MTTNNPTAYPRTTNSASKRRKRPITACIECIRRKQRCNKRRPCSTCIARGVEDKCTFPTEINNPLDLSVEAPHEDLEASDLAVGLGFSPFSKMAATFQSLQSPSTDSSPTSTSASSQIVHSSHNMSRYNVLTAKLPSALITQQLTDMFFSEAGWYLCLVDRPYYEELWRLWKNLHSSTPRSENVQMDLASLSDTETTYVPHYLDVRYFPAMLFQMLALSLHFVPTLSPVRKTLGLSNTSALDRTSQLWSEAGNEIMLVLGRIDSPLTAVLADLLRCTWLKNSGFGLRSWHVLSDAVRQAQHLGLHQKITIPETYTIEATLRALWQDEHRRRVWVSVFSWDAHMALSLGRPRLITAIDCTVESPLDCDLPFEPSSVTNASSETVAQPSRFSAQLFKYSVGLLIHEAMNTGALRSPISDYSVVSNLHQQVENMMDSLPSVYRQDHTDLQLSKAYNDVAKQKQQVSIIGSSFIMALHRPHITQYAKSRPIAISAALDTLAASQSLFELCHEQHYKIHTILFHPIDAVIFLSSMVAIHCRPESSVPDLDIKDLPFYDVRTAIRLAVTRVTTMRFRSKIAGDAAKALQKCYELVSLHENDYHLLTEQRLQEKSYPSAVRTEAWSRFSDQEIPTIVLRPTTLIKDQIAWPVHEAPGTRFRSPPPDKSDDMALNDISKTILDPSAIGSASYTATWMEQYSLTETSLLSKESLAFDEIRGWQFD